MPDDVVDVVLDLVDLAALPEGPPVAGFIGVRVEVGDHEPGPGVGDAGQFLIDRRAVGQVADHQAAPDHVEAAVRQRQGADVGHQGLDLRVMIAARRQHLRRHVDADRQDRAGPAQAAARAASGVQQPLALERRRQARGQIDLQEGDGGLVGIGARPEPVALLHAQHGHGASRATEVAAPRKMEFMSLAPQAIRLGSVPAACPKVQSRRPGPGAARPT